MLCPEGRTPKLFVYLFRAPVLKPSFEGDGSEFRKAIVTFAIRVLLHEMLHAFLDIYACRCWRLCNKIVNSPEKGTGLTGHGAQFCEALVAIEGRAQWFGMGELETGLDMSVATEIQATGWRPSDTQLVRWRVPEDICLQARYAFEKNPDAYDENLRAEKKIDE